MKKALGLVGAALLFAGPALGADLTKAPAYKAPPLAPIFSWRAGPEGWLRGRPGRLQLPNEQLRLGH